MVQAGEPGYPLVRLLVVVECGTRAVLAAVFGTGAVGETGYVAPLLPVLRAGMRLLADRGYDSNLFVTQVAATGADLLLRIESNRRLPVLHRLHDGSYCSVAGSVPVRVIDAVISLRCAYGSTRTGAWRLVTTLTDGHRYPAGELVRLYHQRWEVETAHLAIKHTLLGGRVLRSGTPADVDQELYAEPARAQPCPPIRQCNGTTRSKLSLSVQPIHRREPRRGAAS